MADFALAHLGAWIYGLLIFAPSHLLLPGPLLVRMARHRGRDAAAVLAWLDGLGVLMRWGARRLSLRIPRGVPRPAQVGRAAQTLRDGVPGGLLLPGGLIGVGVALLATMTLLLPGIGPAGRLIGVAWLALAVGTLLRVAAALRRVTAHG